MHEKLYKTYPYLIKLLGFDGSLAHLIQRLDLAMTHCDAILDTGCGPGTIGLTLAEKYHTKNLLMTDINHDLLTRVEHTAAHKRLAADIRFGISDISTPKEVTLTNHDAITLTNHSFDIVSTGAAVGYSTDPIATIKELLSLVKSGGYFIDIEMNKGIFGKYVSWRYDYDIMPTSDMKTLIESQGFSFQEEKFGYFPEKLTRTCYIAKNLN